MRFSLTSDLEVVYGVLMCQWLDVVMGFSYDQWLEVVMGFYVTSELEYDGLMWTSD